MVKIKRYSRFLRLVVTLLLAVMILFSPPVALAKKFVSGHPVSTEKQMTRCNPCPFHSIHRPGYAIILPAGGSWLVLSESTEVHLQEVIDIARMPEEPLILFSPLLC